MNKVLLVLIALITTACAHQTISTKASNGQWSFTEANNNSEKLTNSDLQNLFNTSINSCESSALDAPIKRPNCKYSRMANNCVSAKSFESTFCFKPISTRTCEIDSVKRYKDELFEHVKGCMLNVGWNWSPKSDNYNALQVAINSIPELLDWQKNHPEKWQLVASIDEELLKVPEYQTMSVRERLLAVVKKVKLKIN